MKIIPLGTLEYNWPGFIELCQDSLKISPTRSLDAQGHKISPEAAMLVSLDFLRYGDNNMYTAISRASHTLNFLYFCFLIQCNKTTTNLLIELAGLTRYKISDELLILSGAFPQWIELVLEIGNNKVDYELRFIGDWLYAFFKNKMLGDAFKNITITPLPDKTFLLEKKK